MHNQVLANLHEAHQGTVRIKQRARLTVYCPGLDNNIDNLIHKRQQCKEHLPSNIKEPIILKERPTRPFQEIAIDLCSYAGQDYLITVDCYTNWPHIIPMRHATTTSQITVALQQGFCRTAIPDIIWSDGGLQFTSTKFNQFSQQWGFLHKISSPYHSKATEKLNLQSNR